MLEKEIIELKVFVGGLHPNVSEDDLRQNFYQYGEISSEDSSWETIRLRAVCSEKECRRCIARAKRKHCQEIDRAPFMGVAIQQLSSDNGICCMASLFYNGYGYPAAPFPDPGMYASTAYGAYRFCGNQQHVS